MPKLTDELTTLYAQSGERQAEMDALQSEECALIFRRRRRENSRKINRLSRQGVVTVADLIARLPHLSLTTKQFGIWLIGCLGIHQAVGVLLELLPDHEVRLHCASALSMLKQGKKVRRFFVQIGRRELDSNKPDRHWLDAVIIGVDPRTDDPQVTDLLLDIFERVDLPAWIRGDAGDKLGWVAAISDRRTRWFRRCRNAVLRGLHEDSIEVQFWSMYVIGQMCNGDRRRPRPLNGLEAALPTLRKIAANDHRLAPGYWWPMSAEAEDVIVCIETGRWQEPDAGERWPVSTKLGESPRD